MKISVTEQHIKDGIRRNPSKCPIAQAIRAETPNVVQISVGKFFAYINDGQRAVEWVVSREAAEFVAAFDRGDPVEPFVCEFTQPMIRGVVRG